VGHISRPLSEGGIVPLGRQADASSALVYGDPMRTNSNPIGGFQSPIYQAQTNQAARRHLSAALKDVGHISRPLSEGGIVPLGRQADASSALVLTQKYLAEIGASR
jgi:hypothetical protein